ncbi:MAG: hypothetical protein FWE68_00985 [Defluviitaleaceae bacterium]|nr:hypothetical protein [Defluviitaleaceae bacterium]
MGIDENDLDRVREIQAKRVDVKGVGYLSIDGKYIKDSLIADIRGVQSKFLTTVYITSGEIKIVYVLNADSTTAPQIADIRSDVEGYLAYLYPGGILADIFLFLDDVHDLSAASHRGEIIDTLAEMRSDTCMLYMLSNLNSHKLHEPAARSNMLHCVALLGIMKDYVSLQSSEQIYKWYNERYFQEDCYRTGGVFMTVGYLSIRRPLALIKKMMLVELLTCREQREALACDFVWDTQGFSDDSGTWLRENIYGLCMDAAVNLDGLGNYTNKKALQVLFGDRLERFFEVNFQAARQAASGDTAIRKYLRDCVRDPSRGFYYVHAITAPDGALKNYLEGLMDKTEAEIASLESRAENWQLERCNPPKQRWPGTNRTPDFVYEMAAKYLEPVFERLQPEAALKRLDEALDYVDACHREFERKRKQLTEFITRIKEETEDLRESDDVFIDSGSLNGFYIKNLRALVDTDPKFDAIYSRLWRALENDTIGIYAAELESYIENAVMRHEDFDRGIVDDLTGAWGSAGGSEVYESIWRHIIGNKHFNILLKSGCKNLHSEINVFTDSSGKLARWAGGREKINFFYEENCDSIDVLYHGGAFSPEDLYYEGLYRFN